MISTFRKSLNLLVALTVAFPSYGFAHTEPPPANEPAAGPVPGTPYEKMPENIDKRSPGQPLDSLNVDRFLYLQQEVFPSEVSTLGPINWENFLRFEGPRERRRRLSRLLKVTKDKLEQLPRSAQNANPETDAADALAYARTLFNNYAHVKADDIGIDPDQLGNFIIQVEESSQADTFIRLVGPRIKLSEDVEASITTADDRVRALSTAMIEALLKDHIIEARRRDIPLFLWEAQEPGHKDLANDPIDMHRRAVRLQMVQRVLEGVQQRWDDKTRYNLFNPTEGPIAKSNRAINWWDTRIEVTRDGERLKVLPMKATARARNVAEQQPYFCSGEGACQFSIWKDNALLHSYGVNVKSIATVDQYVVFTHEGGYDAESGTETLMFLDLGTYTGLLGNENIPVFRAPVRVDGPVTQLSAENGVLMVGKNPMPLSQLKLASDLQQPVHNLMANLLDVDSWEKVTPLVDSVQTIFDETIALSRKQTADEVKNAQSTIVLVDEITKSSRALLTNLSLNKPVTQENKDKLNVLVAHTQDESLRHLKDAVLKSDQLAKAMDDSAKEQRLARKMGARVRLLASALVSPRPNAGQIIKNSIGAYLVRKGVGFSDRMNRLVDLSNRPFVTAGVVGAGIFAAVAPESFGKMLEAGLGVGTSTLDYVVWTLSHIGEAVATGTHKTIEPVAGDALLRQYVYDGNGFRAAVGIPAFIGFLAGLYFIPHFIFNYAQLRRDMRNPDIKNFADRMEKFKQAYYVRIAAEEGERRHTGSEFSADEETLIKEFIETRREENARGGIVKRLVRMAKAPFSTILRKVNEGMAYTGADEVLRDSFEKQHSHLRAAMESAEGSAALDRAEHDSKEDFDNFWSAVKANAFGYAIAQPLENAYNTVKTNAGAAKDFMLSAASLELTLERWANIWNEYAMWRFASFGYTKVRVLGTDVPVWPLKPKVLSFASKLIYPEFMSTVAIRRQGQRIMPTVLNGGLRRRFTGHTVGSSIKGAALDDVTGYEILNAEWDPREELKALEKFEDQIIDVEKEVGKAAFKESLEALTHFMTNIEDMKIVFNAKGIPDIARPEIRELSWEARTFLRAHFETAFNAGMKKFLQEELVRMEGPVEDVDLGNLNANPLPTPPLAEATQAIDPNQENMAATLRELKRKIARANVIKNGQAADYGFDIEGAKAAAVAEVARVEHVQAARAAVADGKLAAANIRRNTKFELMADYDPTQNRSIARVATVAKRLESPGAIGRAVRAEITKLTLTVPIELTARLILTAGLFEGALKPIQEEFLSPNSIFYLSGTSFYMMMASGFFMSMMADAWMKLQKDAFQDDLGKFGEIPMGEDARKGALSWYMKQFNSRENTTWKNYKRDNYVIFWNMPAALTNIALFNFLFSGRVDISYIIAGFIITYTTPIGAYMDKIDQAFERFNYYPARGIKEKWTAHPDIQKLILPEMQKLRYKVALFKDILTTSEADWLTNLEFAPTSLGTRGLQRAFFGGSLLEESIINGWLTPLQKAVHGVPVLDHVVTPLAKGCAALLSTGNTDLKLLK